MPAHPAEEIAVGACVRVRGDQWTVVSVTPFDDCRSLRLTGSGPANAGQARTLLLPFDRPRPLRSARRIRAARRRRWAHAVNRSLLGAHPFGGLRAAAGARFDLLPFQLEPALAMLRHGRLRLLIADAVGLGKTIQTGIILNELAAAADGFRGVILTPAGVREQWQRELRSRFSLETTLADATWLSESARNLPGDVNPWALPGIFIASLDLVKRPEVLRAMEDVAWDLLVVDEVHGAGLATARLAAVDAVGARSRRVVLLTATPPDGEPSHLAALCAIGARGNAAPITRFRRSRHILGMTEVRKSRLLPVRVSRDEARMHRLLERYTGRLWREASAHRDSRARLLAVVLRKRALSSAASLLTSVRRRLSLLGCEPELRRQQQLLLPYVDEDPLDDHVSEQVMGSPGFADAVAERTCLEEIALAAERAGRQESKLEFLLRLLARLREPAVVFTEYRDTLERIAAATRDHAPLLLHGGLTPRERSAVQRAFNVSGLLLLATDAASEGLNLHHRCRLVVHFELPWTPMRLEQRTGRVDRLGQSRPVHELVLVASDTAERLVLGPLMKRARAAASHGGGPASAITESAVAAALMEGRPVDPPRQEPARHVVEIDLRVEAADESQRLAVHRLLGRSGPAVRAHDDIHVCATAPSSASGILLVVSVVVQDANGRAIHAEVVPVLVRGERTPTGRTARETEHWASGILERHARGVIEMARQYCFEQCRGAMVLFREQAEAAAARERAMAAPEPSAARMLVQAGLFDRRQLDAARRREQVRGLLADDMRARLLALRPDVPLITVARIIGIRAGWRPR